MLGTMNVIDQLHGLGLNFRFDMIMNGGTYEIDEPVMLCESKKYIITIDKMRTRQLNFYGKRYCLMTAIEGEILSHSDKPPFGQKVKVFINVPEVPSYVFGSYHTICLCLFTDELILHS